MTGSRWPAGPGDPPSYSAHAPSSAMNEALAQWLMAPEAEGVRLTLEDFLGRPEWHQQAACNGETALYFSGATEYVEKARAICQACAVREECHKTAMSDPDLQGVWAGFTEKERVELRRSRVA